MGVCHKTIGQDFFQLGTPQLSGVQPCFLLWEYFSRSPLENAGFIFCNLMRTGLLGNSLRDDSTKIYKEISKVVNPNPEAWSTGEMNHGGDSPPEGHVEMLSSRRILVWANWAAVNLGSGISGPHCRLTFS